MKHPRPLSPTQTAPQGPVDSLEAVRRQILSAYLLTGLGGGLAVAAAGSAVLAAVRPGGRLPGLVALAALGVPPWVSLIAIAVLLALAAAFCILRGRHSLRRSLDAIHDQIKDLAVERDRSRQEARARQEDAARRLEQVRAAAEASHLAASTLDDERLLEQLAGLLLERFNLTYAGIYLAEAQGGAPALRAAAGAGAQDILDGGRAPADARGGPHRPDGARSEAELPVVYRERRLGTIVLQSVQLNAFDAEDMLVMRGIAGALACSLRGAAQQYHQVDSQGRNDVDLARENARLLELMERRTRREQLVGEIAAQAQGSLNLDAILRTTAQELGLALGGARVQVSLEAQDGSRSSGGQE